MYPSENEEDFMVFLNRVFGKQRESSDQREVDFIRRRIRCDRILVKKFAFSRNKFGSKDAKDDITLMDWTRRLEDRAYVTMSWWPDALETNFTSDALYTHTLYSLCYYVWLLPVQNPNSIFVVTTFFLACEKNESLPFHKLTLLTA